MPSPVPLNKGNEGSGNEIENSLPSMQKQDGGRLNLKVHVSEHSNSKRSVNGVMIGMKVRRVRERW